MPPRPTSFPHPKGKTARGGVGLIALACCISIASASGAMAQNSQGSFSLPEPTPTPSPAPQGPVDVRSGVPIAPRPIPDPQPTPSPANADAQPEQAPPTSDEDLNTAINDALVQSSESAAAPRSARPAPSAAGERTISPPQTPWAAVPGIGESNLASPDTNETGLATPVHELDTATLGPPQAPSAIETAQTDKTPASPFPIWIWALVALGLGIVAGCAAIVLRARKAREADVAPILARDTLPSKQEKPIKPTQAPAPVLPNREPSPPQHQPRIDVDIEIVSATRSLMMFTFECRLTLANRSDQALRDISLGHRLICAQKGMAGGRDIFTGAGGSTIERIGPSQSQTVEVQLTLPLGEIEVIRQGNKPLCIPMAFVTVFPEGAEPSTKSFVIGSPSLANSERLHPIALDTPPGGIPGLLAREVKTDRKPAQAA